MKIQRYIAKDMRSALAQVREALGADAAILSSGRIGDDVEVIAAVDMEVVQQVAATAVDASPRQAPRAPQRSKTQMLVPSGPTASVTVDPTFLPSGSLKKFRSITYRSD